MRFSRPLLVTAAMLTLVSSSALALTQEEVRMKTDVVVPLRQAVSLRLDPDRTDYTGSTRIEVEVKKNTREIRLHAEEMTISNVVLTPPNGGTPIPLTHRMDPRYVLVVQAPSAIAPGRYTLSMDFANEFGTKAVGLYRMTQGEDGYAFTQFEPDDAREAFPCWDEPSFKIPFRFTISVPEAHVAVFNTPAEDGKLADGWRTTTFEETPPMPTYLLALAAGRLERVNMPGLSVPGAIYTTKGQSHLTGLALEMTPPILAALEEYFGEAYPYAKCDFIAIPEYWAGAMENPGAITYNATILLNDPERTSLAQRARLARIIAHELAHIWFGDVVTMEWWDDLWLNEAFADWMGDKIANQVYPEFRLDVTEMGASIRVMNSDARPSSQAIRRPVTDTSDLLQNIGVQYNKGKAVLAMFENYLGEATFRRGVNQYLAAHRWGNAAAGDLWAALREASGQDVPAAMNTFIEQPGVPLVSVESVTGDRVRLVQRRYSTYGVQQPQLRWQIPIVLRFADDNGVDTRTILLGSTAQEVELKAKGKVRWVLPNADQRGYYRWSAPPEMLRTLVGPARSELSLRERIGLASSVGEMLGAGTLQADAYLAALQGMASDTSPMVVDAVLSEMARTRRALASPDVDEAYASYVRQSLTPAFERWGVTPTPDESPEVNLVRPTLLAALADEGRDEAVRTELRALAEAYAKNPGSVDPSIVGIALRVAAFDGDRALFDQYKAGFESATVPTDRLRYLQALGCFRKPELRQAALAYQMDGPIRPNELRWIPNMVGQDPAAEDELFEWYLRIYPGLTQRLPPVYLSFMPQVIITGCSRERLERGEAFFSDPAHQVEGTEESVAKAGDVVKECLALKEREGARAASYLQGLVGKK